ncbi:hypothetical protein M3J09_001309 [Ascochyta lentis]
MPLHYQVLYAKSQRCSAASIEHASRMRAQRYPLWSLGSAPTRVFGHVCCQSIPTSARCEVVRSIGDLRLDPVMIE